MIGSNVLKFLFFWLHYFVFIVIAFVFLRPIAIFNLAATSSTTQNLPAIALFCFTVIVLFVVMFCIWPFLFYRILVNSENQNTKNTTFSQIPNPEIEYLKAKITEIEQRGKAPSYLTELKEWSKMLSDLKVTATIEEKDGKKIEVNTHIDDELKKAFLEHIKTITQPINQK
jgi:hypothetical protein